MSRSQENVDKLTPTLQGVSSVTFHAPPLDQGLSVPQLYEYNARNSPDHSVFCYASIDTGIVHDITYSEAWNYICSTAKMVQSRLSDAKGLPSPISFGSEGRPVIAILALSGTALSF